MIRYGIDLHGTLACRQPDGSLTPSAIFPLLKQLMAFWSRSEEAEVYIVSGSPISQLYSELSSLGLEKVYHYDRAVSMVHFLKQRGIPMHENPPESNHWWCDGGTWNAAKGWIADVHNIDVLIDNEWAYKNALRTTKTFIHVESSVCSISPDPKEG